MSHLKAYAAPKSWTLLRKVRKWVSKPQPGAHPLERSIPVGFLLKQLGYAQTAKEARKIINMRAVQVDGKEIKDVHFCVGFMDSILIKPDIPLRCGMDEKGKLRFVNITQSEIGKKICQITGKRTLRGGKIQLNLSDGRNILAEKNKHAVGDSLLIEVTSQKITEHFPLEKGSTAFLTGGRHIGMIGKIDEIKGERIWCTKGKEKIETLKKFAFVMGKDKPALKI